MNLVVFVAWRSGDATTGEWGPVGRLERIPSGYRFVYTRGAQQLKDFHPFPGMEDLEAIYESEELFPLFANRLLRRSRPEYLSFLKWSGFDPDQPPDPIALLSVTEGQRATDALEIIPAPQRDSSGCYLTKFFLHGLRWMPQPALECIHRLQPGDPLGLLPDIHNRYDPYAVAVRTLHVQDRYLIGYVPRYLAQDVRLLCLSCDPQTMQLTVERVNRDAPLQFRLLCRLRACWPEHFVPCHSEQYQPIPQLTPVETFAASGDTQPRKDDPLSGF
jgi:hypothetical protein